MMYAQKHKHTEPAPSERRREPRLPFKSNTVMLVTYKGGGPLYFGDCKTIDKQSLMMEVEHPVPPGKKIECKFTLPWTERSVYLQGIVMDVLPPKHQGGKSRMKVRFLSLDHNVLKSLDAYLQKKRLSPHATTNDMEKAANSTRDPKVFTKQKLHTRSI